MILEEIVLVICFYKLVVVLGVFIVSVFVFLYGYYLYGKFLIEVE